MLFEHYIAEVEHQQHFIVFSQALYEHMTSLH